MFELKDKQVLVVGLGARGRAACELLRNRGANVVAVDEANTEELRAAADSLRPLGVEVQLGVTRPPDRHFNLAVISPAVPGAKPIVQEIVHRHIPVIGEYELGLEQARCLNIAIAGTNGKSTTGALIERILCTNNRPSAWCGKTARPICSVVSHDQDLEFLLPRVDASELETAQQFRPAVAVMLNLAPDHRNRYANHEEYVRAIGRLFENQEAFNWAIVQHEALTQMRALNIPIPSKVISFSARDRSADIYMDRGLLISRRPEWAGPLLDLDRCHLRGVHNAENLMAALAVGHVLHVPLDSMIDVLRAQMPSKHCFEPVAEIGGVKFIDDSKSSNPDALEKALLSIPPASGGAPNVWLIAGGHDTGLNYASIGPLLSRRVKAVKLFGEYCEYCEKLFRVWNAFSPCTRCGSLLEAVQIAARSAAHGDVILFSPACSSFDQFRSYQHMGEVFRDAVNDLAATICGVVPRAHHNRLTTKMADRSEISPKKNKLQFVSGFFEEKPRYNQPKLNPTSKERTLTSANHR